MPISPHGLIEVVMKRKQVTQFMNRRWYPDLLKNLMFEFMSWFVGIVGAAKPFMPLIEEAIEKSGSKTLINLKQNTGAGFETVRPYLPDDISTLDIDFTPGSFSADQDGIYVMINGFHQLNPGEARQILQTLAAQKKFTLILEGNNDSLRQIFGMTIIVPLTVILTAPFVKPFRFSRLIFSWVIPILPFITMIDGCLALLKLYNPDDLNELTGSLENGSGYNWQSGKADNGRGGKIIYLTGRPDSEFTIDTSQ